MNIFIDESGTFTLSPSSVPNISVVGALIIPDERLTSIEQRYARIRVGLPKDKGEVKGRLLSEVQVDRVATMLRRNEALFEATAIDLSHHALTDISMHQEGQAIKITENLTEQFTPEARQYITGLRRRLEELACTRFG